MISFSKSSFASYRGEIDQRRGRMKVAGRNSSRKCCDAAPRSRSIVWLYSALGLKVSPVSRPRRSPQFLNAPDVAAQLSLTGRHADLEGGATRTSCDVNAVPWQP